MVLVRVFCNVAACNFPAKCTLYIMVLCGMDAMMIWCLGRRLQEDSGRASVPPQAVTVQYCMDPFEDRLWVGLQITSVRLGDGNICSIDGHVTFLVGRDMQHITFSPQFWHDVEERGIKILEENPLIVAGDLLPMYSADDCPHRLLLNLHVQS